MPDVEPLATLLALEPVGVDSFTAPTHGPDAGVQRLFGGHVAAQALHAASRTVPAERAAHSVHCAFVRAGKPGRPIRIDVSRDRDGRSFATRQVTVRQGDTVIFEMTASFQEPEDGPDWTATPMPDVPGPDDVPEHRTFLHDFATLSVFRWRTLVGPARTTLDPIHPAWLRTAEPLPDDPAVHRVAIASMTDMGSVRGVLLPDHRPEGKTFAGASLDHAVWFHRPARADDWLLFDVQPISNHGGRGLGLGRVWSTDGRHVATWTQEALVRFK